MIENPALSDFPVHPQKKAGESLDGWCWRIYVSNGHTVPQDVRSSLRGTKAVRQLTTNLSLSDLLGADLLQSIEAEEAEVLERWDPQCSVEWHAWSKAIRICPLCIRTSGCHCMLWQLPLVAACPVHHCKLTESCLSCGQRLSWSSLSYGWQCTCGARLGELPTASAPLWQIKLARMLSRADDVQVSDDVRTVSANTLSEVPHYRARDLYGMLWWCLKLRRTMTESNRRFYNLAKTWPVVKRRGARMEPRAWEVSVVDGHVQTWISKGNRMFNWYLRSQEDSHTHVKIFCFPSPMPVTLTGPENWRCFQRLVALMQELVGNPNPLATAIRYAVERAVDEHSAGIPGIPMVFFHPRLSSVQRQERIRELTHWWAAFSQTVPSVGPIDQLLYESDATNPTHIWEDYHQTAGVPLLNIFFSAARLQLPPEQLGILARRWHVPVELRRPKDILLDVGGYVGNLFEEELNFIYALLNVTTHRPASDSSTAGCDE